MIQLLRALAVFAKTIEHGSFRSAAAELKLSPSVVSHHISQLEQHLGVTLIYRSTRTLSLTRDGEQLIGAARAMVAAAEAGVGAIRQRASALSGELRVTAPAVLAKSKLTRRIADFLIANPNVKISIDYSDQRRDVVGEGIDIAIRMGWLRDSALKARKLYEVDRILTASSGYMAARPMPKSPKDIEHCDWLELSVVPLKPAFRHASKKTITLRPKPRLSTTSASALYELASGGAGLAILPRFLVEADLDAGRMVHLLPDWKIESVTVYAVRPGNSPAHGLTTEFVSALCG